MDNSSADVVGVCLAGAGDRHTDWSGGWFYLWLSRGHPGQYSDGANDGYGVFHAAEPAGEHLGISGGVDEAV